MMGGVGQFKAFFPVILMQSTWLVFNGVNLVNNHTFLYTSFFSGQAESFAKCSAYNSHCISD
jgi:hypothetical protein